MTQRACTVVRAQKPFLETVVATDWSHCTAGCCLSVVHACLGVCIPVNTVAVFAGVAMIVTLLRMRLQRETLLQYLWPTDRKIGLRPVAVTPTLSRFQSWSIAVVAFCDLWFRCAPFSVPEVSRACGCGTDGVMPSTCQVVVPAAPPSLLTRQSCFRAPLAASVVALV